MFDKVAVLEGPALLDALPLDGFFGSEALLGDVTILRGVELLGGVPPRSTVTPLGGPLLLKDIVLLAGEGGVLVRVLAGLL